MTDVPREVRDNKAIETMAAPLKHQGGPGPEPKDWWDKFEKASTFLATVVLAAVSLIVTSSINARVADRDAALREVELSNARAQRDVELRNAQLETVQGFMPYLTGTGPQADIAILAISILGDDSVAVGLGAAIHRQAALQGLLPQLARMDQAGLLQNILDIGARPDSADAAGNTPLMLAASAGAMRALDVLIKSGANVNSQSRRTGWTPLMFAAARGRHAVLVRLLASGAQVDVVNARGEAALWLAAQAGDSFAVASLGARGAAVDQVDRDRWTPLHAAAAGGYLSVVQDLTQRGANLDQQTMDGETALMAASEGGHVGVVGALLSLGANRDLRDRSGATALDKAQRFGHLEVVALFGT